MRNRIVFRADASKKIGYGHFVRSLALCGYLNTDFDCHFATYNNSTDDHLPTEYELRQIIGKANPLPLDAASFDSFNEDFIDNVGSNDIVVLDNYYFDTDYQRKIKRKGCKLVCIDDMHNRHMLCDLLLTMSPVERKHFSLEPYTIFAGGIEWALLRDPFLKPLPNRTLSEGINNVVLGMGGSDAFNVSDKMVRIVNYLLPEAEINIICGDGVEISSESEKKVRVHRSLSAEEIVDLFDNADIGIFPASTICIEALSRRLPVIAGYYVDNQLEFYNYGVRNGYFSPGGDFLAHPHKIENTLERIFGNSLPCAPQIDFSLQKQKYIDLFKSL